MPNHKYTVYLYSNYTEVIYISNSPFLKNVRKEIRLRGYSIRTEKTYIYWIKQFIFYHKKKHPDSMEAEEVKNYFSSMAEHRSVAINTQKVALNALVFLYHQVLNRPLDNLNFRYATKQVSGCLDKQPYN